MGSMKVTRSRLATVVAQRAQSSESVKKLARELAAYLLAEHRSGELDSIMRDIQQYRADHGIVEVLAASAYPLSPEVCSEIESMVRQLYPGASKVIISPLHDKSALGGVRLEFANEQLDLTLRAKLNRFKQLTAVGQGV